MKKTSNSIIFQLQVVFTISIILLLISLVASFYSTNKLILNSNRVNHTNEVLREAENIISYIKDAETGQRGYIITSDPEFLEPYKGAYDNTTSTYNNLLKLTRENPTQQRALIPLKERYEARFAQMDRIVTLNKKKIHNKADSLQQLSEMRLGKKIMDDVRLIVDQVKVEEEKMLQEQLSQQELYIQYTPFLLLFAALVSILITGFAYFRIKRDMDRRLAKQLIEEEKYKETRLRILKMEEVTRGIASGNYEARIIDQQDDELGRIAHALNHMTDSLEETFNNLKEKGWLQTGSMFISEAMRGERILENLSSNLIRSLSSYMDAPLGTIYIRDQDWNFKLTASHAANHAPATLIVGNGITGQAIETGELVIVKNIPHGYTSISSTLGSSPPTAIAVLPLVYAGECIGVIELGLLTIPNALQLEFLKANQESIAIGVNAALDYVRLQNFLEETQAQAEELQTQHNELENLNAELEAQAQKLQVSEEELRVQQEELQQTNEELEERSVLLEERNFEILKKAEELEQTTRYKSEFLANMSHELRTPLNSILLLSRLLADNEENNLTEDQVEYANVIRSSGNGLLGLIDEILDLSKIEAGKMDLDFTTTSLAEVARDLQSLFVPVAKDKRLEFSVHILPGLPPIIETDRTRLDQILKNLVSNALKFTSKGSVQLEISQGESENQIRFTVKDTGIGIAPEKQNLIFDAFQQADGSTKRKYGGTGLGLSISRELAKLLGGDIAVNSIAGKGSEFSLTIPTRKTVVTTPEESSLNAVNPALPLIKEKQQAYINPVIPASIPDDREHIKDTDKVILIIEDDTFFARTLLDYTRKKGYKGIVAVRGDEGLELAEKFRPLGILLDIELPVLNGWEVMDALKKNTGTRPIPVHMMSSHRMKNESLQKGAVDFIDKPVVMERMKEVFEKIEYVISRKAKKVLIVEDNSKHAKALAYFLSTFNINSELKENISEGVDALQNNELDCVILDMGIPDLRAYETLEEVRKNPGLENVPIIIFTGKSLSMTEELRIKQYADSIIVKTAHSYQRMLDEVSLFLHVVEENEKPLRATNSRSLGGLADVLQGKTVLIADDDVRNIFSLTKALENFKMNVVTALDGQEALIKLEENPEINVVLLDMMMPQLDGYETARRIRERPQWENLPVIAVTAKAMTGDREKCINAGASDYIDRKSVV